MQLQANTVVHRRSYTDAKPHEGWGLTILFIYTKSPRSSGSPTPLACNKIPQWYPFIHYMSGYWTFSAYDIYTQALDRCGIF